MDSQNFRMPNKRANLLRIHLPPSTAVSSLGRGMCVICRGRTMNLVLFPDLVGSGKVLGGGRSGFGARSNRPTIKQVEKTNDSARRASPPSRGTTHRVCAAHFHRRLTASWQHRTLPTDTNPRLENLYKVLAPASTTGAHAVP